MSVSGCVCCSRNLWQSWCLVWNILCGFGQPAAAVATEDGEEGWNLHANPSVSSVRKSFEFFWSILMFSYTACFLSLSLSLSPSLSLSLSSLSSLSSSLSLSPLSLSLSLDILSAQEMIKSSLPTFSGALNDKTLQLNNVNSISAQSKRIHNASEYETDPNHVTGIISPKNYNSVSI